MRARCQLIYQRAKKNQLAHFDVDSTKFGETAKYLVSMIKVAQNPPPTLPSFTNRRLNRETTPQTIPKYLLMAGGNTSKRVDDLESNNSSEHGPKQSTLKKRPVV